jgi:hypothetical protein
MNTATTAILEWIEANESSRWDERAEELVSETSERNAADMLCDEMYDSFEERADYNWAFDLDTVEDAQFSKITERIIGRAWERSEYVRAGGWRNED